MGSKTTIYISLGLHIVRPNYKRSLQLLFFNFVLFLWVIFALLDPDPDSEYGSGSTDLIEFGSNPDPKPWSYTSMVRHLPVVAEEQEDPTKPVPAREPEGGSAGCSSLSCGRQEGQTGR